MAKADRLPTRQVRYSVMVDAADFHGPERDCSRDRDFTAKQKLAARRYAQDMRDRGFRVTFWDTLDNPLSRLFQIHVRR